MTEALPVARVPEEFFVPAVRDHMIDVSGSHISSLLYALLAQRVRLKEFLSRLLPGMTVAASSG